MSESHPTPLSIAGRKLTVSDRKPDPGAIAVDERRRQELQELLATIALIGPTAEGEDSPQLVQRCVSKINPFVQSSVSSVDLAEVWISVLDGELPASPTDLLFIEYWTSIGYAQMKTALGRATKRFKYMQTLFAIRKRVAFALYEYAKEINWRQPVAFVSALKVARAYLRDAAGHSTVGSGRDYGHFTGKLGVATVLISGFEAVTEDEAREAYQALRTSLDHGNDAVSALPYLISAATLSFDYSENVEDLRDAVAFSARFGRASRSVALRLATAQAQLRIAICTRDTELLARVNYLVGDVIKGNTYKVVDFLTARILKGITQHVRLHGFADLTTAQLRVPFGYRTGDDTHPLLVASAREVFIEFANCGRLEDPLVANLLADLIVNCRRGLKINEVQALNSAVRYRRAGRVRGDDDLVSVQNKLELASLNQNQSARLAAIESLAVIAADARYTAAAQMVLAHNVESWGGIVDSKAVRLDKSSGLVQLAVNGSARDLWLLAARSAFENANLVKRGLGGRSSVTTVGDYYGLVTETLVFKRMDRSNYQRGAARSEEIQRALNETDAHKEFGVPVILDAKETADTVVVAHRFVSGISLMKLFETTEPQERLRLAAEAARFLGFINKLEEHKATDQGMRMALKRREVGRFLRSCGVEDYMNMFTEWWETVAQVDKVTRKDAHLENWLLSQDGRLVAIDWEASGCRPIGYELAQITDDHAFFAADDWETRRAIFEAYLEQVDHTASVEECWRAYKAGVLARHLWLVTSPERSKQFEPGEAESRLQAYASSVDDEQLAAIALGALKAILVRRGLAGIPPMTKNTTGAGRVRLSKRIAHLLRHRLDVERDEAGWVEIAAVARELGDVSAQEVATVATDPREARFEVDRARVRARYGHSAEVNHTIVFDDSIAPETRLYHASPWVFATEILDQEKGLQAKSRGMVHLTDSFSEAVASGVRGGHPLVYETEAARLSRLVKAGVITFLTPEVRATQLQVVPMASYWRHVPALKNLLS